MPELLIASRAMSEVDVYLTPQDVPEDIDSVVILGKQLGVGASIDDLKDSPDGLSDASRTNVDGGAMLWIPGRRLILSGNGDEKIRFPQAGADYIEENYPDIPSDAYRNPDKKSRDTLLSAKNVLPMLVREGLRETVIASVGKHGVRATYMFKNEGAKIRGIAVTNKIVASRSNEDAARIRAWERKPATIADVVKEAALRNFDPRGTRTQYVSRMFRP